MAFVVEEVASGEPLVRLDDPAATDPALVGAKAAALARAARAGLPVLPGFVITTEGAGLLAAAPDGSRLEVEVSLRDTWRRLSEGGARSLVVRSSSTVEDDQASSMAGVFTSVVDVRGWEDFRAAVTAVLGSSKLVSLDGAGATQAPMAVLVQPLLDAAAGGVLFAVDPVTGRRDRMVVAAIDDAPAALVSGDVDGTRSVMSRHGRLIEASGDGVEALLDRRRRHLLAGLARQAASVFGGPQDLEWAFDRGGRLWLLQSRPITAVAPSARRGPLLGPGPVAETFPEALSVLEEDLWLVPLRTALVEALRLAGTASRRKLTRSFVVTTVGGRVAADLGLLAPEAERRGVLGRLDPRPPARRLVAAWRVGRLRAALPALAADMVARADAELLAVPPLGSLTDRQLVAVLEGTRQRLVALGGHEVLMGWLVSPGTASTTAASVGLRALANARAEGWSDEEIVARRPTVLSLLPPRVGPPAPLPPAPDVAPPLGDADPMATLREALRLRARWVQELGARAAWELAGRLERRGAVPEREWVRWMTLAELREVLASGVVPDGVSARRPASAAPPLPARFRLASDGSPVAVASRRRAARSGGGMGAGGGRAMGTVHDGVGRPPAGSVLVVRTLDPELAPLLPGLAGLVAETGSVLSHLAILAREFGVATAVGIEAATTRFPPGTTLAVDGTTGEVSIVGPERTAQAAPRGAA